MATYGQLLLDAGGGVIDRGKQSDRQEGATVVIGLGGTGTDAVLRLKREMFKQLKSDDPEAAIPTYKSIKYLVIDSDDAKIKGQSGKITDIDKNTEFFSVANNTIKATFGAKKIMDNRPELYWLDYEHISIDDASAGAGGIRQVGRFLLVDRAESLYAKLKSVMEEALLGAKTGKLNIHVCAGISGGTGSGTFLDVCYLIRKALQEIGKPESSVCGYFFLPDVNLSVAEVRENPLISKYIKVNGYAALQELDYCMNFGKNKDSFKMNYGFTKLDFNMKPVDLCYLISTTDSTGNRIPNGYQYAMGVVTDFIISFLAKVKLPDGADDKNNSGLTLEGHISNLNSIKAGIVMQHGAGVDYNILGASVAVMPLSEIATYLGSRLFECYREMYDRVPIEKERDMFLVNKQLQYEDIRKSLTKGCAGAVMFADAFDAKMYQTMGNSRFVDRAADFLAHNKGEMEKNYKTLIENISKDYEIPKESTSLINRTYKGLCDDFISNLDFGAFYAKRMLYGQNNQNLIHAVDGFIAKNKENLAHEMRQSQIRDDEYNQAKMRMDGAGALNKNSRITEYKNALNNLYVHHYRIEMFKTMESVLTEYKRQLVNLDQSFFNILTTVLDTLRETFSENAKILSEGVKSENSYTWKILSVNDVQDGLDEVIKKLDLGQTLYDLMINLLDNCKKWINQDENEISKLISDFVLREFGDATKKTMTDYLREKFQTENSTLLTDKIKTNIIEEKLWKDSTPLFWLNTMYQKETGKQNTLTVPFDAAEIKQAAYDFAGGYGVTVRESYITDKLSMMRFHSGLPMFAYQGIQELQHAYEADKKPGRHLYERGEVNWNEMLPSPIPASFEVTAAEERIAKRNEEILADFDKAEEAGIIGQDAMGNWDIRKTEDLDIEQYLKEAAGGKDIAALDAGTLNGVIQKLDAKINEIRSSVETVRIEHPNAVEGSDKQVMLDFYLLSPVLNGIVRKELEKKAAIDARMVELKEQLTVGGKEIREKNNFFNAIFTGVLTYGKRILYSYEEFGIPKEVELQNSRMEYGQSGAYQAFLTYKTLDDAVKQKIDAATMIRMDEEDSPEVNAAIESLNAKMPQRINSYMTLYAADLKCGEIKQFYEEFMRAFEVFKLQNI